MQLYKYSGTVSGFSYRRNDPNALPFVELDLCDIGDDSKAPVRIEAIGGLADYINNIEGTDAEERYITADWFYNRNLYLCRIEIPSSVPGRPAKIIAQLDPFCPDVTIFGPAEYIETDKPEPMTAQQMGEWYKFREAVTSQTGWR